jgi:hypothetical protein
MFNVRCSPLADFSYLQGGVEKSTELGFIEEFFMQCMSRIQIRSGSGFNGARDPDPDWYRQERKVPKKEKK